MRLFYNRMTLKKYIICLVLNDLQANMQLYPGNIPVDNIISEDSVNEAQKVLDFVRNILAGGEST